MPVQQLCTQVQCDYRNYYAEDFGDCLCNADKGSFCSCKVCARRFYFLVENCSPEHFDERLRYSSVSQNESGNVCLRNLYIINIVWTIIITHYVFLQFLIFFQ